MAADAPQQLWLTLLYVYRYSNYRLMLRFVAGEGPHVIGLQPIKSSVLRYLDSTCLRFYYRSIARPVDSIEGCRVRAHDSAELVAAAP